MGRRRDGHNRARCLLSNWESECLHSILSLSCMPYSTSPVILIYCSKFYSHMHTPMLLALTTPTHPCYSSSLLTHPHCSPSLLTHTHTACPHYSHAHTPHPHYSCSRCPSTHSHCPKCFGDGFHDIAVVS